MQAFFSLQSQNVRLCSYNGDMRKSDLTRERPGISHRLITLRQAVGLTQIQLAKLVHVHPSNIGFWELKGTPPRGEVLPALARVLGVSVDEILGVEPIKPRRQVAKGKLQQLFEAASHLPRRQQQKIVEFVEPFIATHGNGHKQAA
jgi:transcriptional regulator with XRE-family HTH domain